MGKWMSMDEWMDGWMNYMVNEWWKNGWLDWLLVDEGGGPRVVVSNAAFHARGRGSVPGPGGLKETKMFLSHPRVKLSIVGSLGDREVACSASDRQGLNFESCVWKTVSSHSSHHPQEVLLAQFSLCVHKGGLKPDSFHFFVGGLMTGGWIKRWIGGSIDISIGATVWMLDDWLIYWLINWLINWLTDSHNEITLRYISTNRDFNC